MKIKTIHYKALLNLGNYSNESIGFTAEFEPELETVNAVIESLKEKVKEVGGTNADEFYSKQLEARQRLAELESKIRKATQQWNATAEFLRAQGIKPDAADMPPFNNLLPEVKQEHSRVVDGEIEEVDATEDIPFEQQGEF